MKPEELIGMTLGKGTLHSLLGQGTLGVVYLAYYPHFPQPVAIKIFPPSGSLEPALQQEFQQQLAQLLAQNAQLEHPHILSALEQGAQKAALYQITPYATQGNLLALLNESGSLPFAQIQLFLEQLAAALDHAHAKNMLHRDLKPENILLASPEHLLVADFNLTRLTTEQRFARARRPVPG